MKGDTLGSRVTSLRKSRGFNQKQLAETAGVTPATLSRIEAGKINKIRPETLMGLSRALGVSAEYITGKTDQVNPSHLLESDECLMDVFTSYIKLGKERRETLRNMARFLATEEAQQGNQV